VSLRRALGRTGSLSAQAMFVTPGPTYLLTGFRVCSMATLFIAMEKALACKLSWRASRSINSCFVPDADMVRFWHSLRRSCRFHGIYVILWVGSIGFGEAWTPVMWRPRLAGVDVDAFWRLRKALKDEARGAAMVSRG